MIRGALQAFVLASKHGLSPSQNTVSNPFRHLETFENSFVDLSPGRSAHLKALFHPQVLQDVHRIAIIAVVPGQIEVKRALN